MRAWRDEDWKFAEVVRTEDDLHPYQGEAIDWIDERPFSALFIDTGLGKTVICLSFLNRLFMRGDLGRVLIVAPVRVAAETWPTEIRLWEHTAYLNFTVLRVEDDDPDVKRAGDLAAKKFRASPDYAAKMAEAERLKEAKREARYWATTPLELRAVRRMPIGETPATVAQRARTAEKHRKRRILARKNSSVHIINREALEWLVQFWGKDWPYDTVIIDESSCVSDHRTHRFKALVKVRRKLARLIELTATPAANSYMGLFAQTYLVDLGARFGRSITHWRETYFDYNPYSRVYKLKPGAQKKISAKVAGFAKVMKSKDYLKEEDPLFLTRPLHMLPEEAQAYHTFERTLIYTLPDGEQIEAETASALSGKLLQLASGAVYNKSGETRIIHDHKLEDLAQLAEELEVAGEPLMVAYWYKSSLARLRKRFPHAVVMDKAGRMVKPWNDGKIKMLLVHPASVGHGLNLQTGPGHDLYMFDQCWSYELFYQLYRRLHRQGQKLRVRIHMAMMTGTNDEIVVERLKEKEDAQEALFSRIKWLHRLALARRRDELPLAA